MENPLSPLDRIAPDSTELDCHPEVVRKESTLVPVESLRDTPQPSNHRGSNAHSSIVARNETRHDSIPLSTHHELGSQNHEEVLNPPGNSSASSAGSVCWRRKPTWPNRKGKRWIFILIPITLCFLVALIAVIVLYVKSRQNNTPTTEDLVVSTDQPSLALPVAHGSLGATVIVLAILSTAQGDPQATQTQLVYNAGNGTICIRSKSGDDWLDNVQCVFGANPKSNTPVTILDWIGGPSIYFITTDNTLSGIDNVPANNTWKLSIMAAQMTPTHPLSQLASVTWLNGTSAWLYYTDVNSELHEYGIDDYRDEAWRQGSTGTLGLTQTGSGIGCARYLVDGGEVLEVFIQATNGAIHGRVFSGGVWNADFYAVDGESASEAIMGSASLTATAITQPNGIFVFLAYVASNSFLTVQSRGIVNVTQYNAFSTPINVVQGDGESETGLAAIGFDGAPKLYFGIGQKILELSGSSVTATNWTQVVVTSL
jgi:hypothetical protein